MTTGSESIHEPGAAQGATAQLKGSDPKIQKTWLKLSPASGIKLSAQSVQMAQFNALFKEL